MTILGHLQKPSGVESVFFLSGSSQEPPDLILFQEVSHKEKIVRLHSRDLGPAPNEPGQV